MTRRLRIAIPLFPQFTALDAIGPYEVLRRIRPSTSPSSVTPWARYAPTMGCSA